jgi:hypothetical protein
VGGVEVGSVVQEVGGLEGIAGLAGEETEEFDEVGALAFVSELEEFAFELGGVGIVGISLETEMAEGESAAVIGPTRHPASRVASSYRCNRCEPERLVEPSTTPSSSLSIPVSRISGDEALVEGVVA